MTSLIGWKTPDDLDAVAESDTGDELRQLINAFEAGAHPMRAVNEKLVLTGSS